MGLLSAATGLVLLYQVQYDDQLGQFFGLGTKINEQHRSLLTPDEVRLPGADSVIIFSANVPPIQATRIDPLMLRPGGQAAAAVAGARGGALCVAGAETGGA